MKTKTDKHKANTKTKANNPKQIKPKQNKQNQQQTKHEHN